MSVHRLVPLALLSLQLIAACGDDDIPKRSAADAGAGSRGDAAVDVAGPADGSLDPAQHADAAETDGASHATPDAEVEPSLSFAAAAGKTWEGTGKWLLDVELSAAASQEVRVSIAVEPASTAAQPADFALPSTALIIAAGQKHATAELSIVDDASAEANEVIVLGLTAVHGATLGAQQSFTLTVVDDESRAWPGASAVSTVDDANVLGDNMSDLAYVPASGASPAVLWAVKNNESRLFQLTWNGTTWVPVTTDGWAAGKRLSWSAGTNPDCEGVVVAEYASSALYVVTERDNDAAGTSRNSVLRFDTSGAGTTLLASNEWNVTLDLPVPTDTNLGLEAVGWIPDSFLVAQGFYDESRSAVYDPSAYPDHGSGVFFLGLELNGMIYAYALNHANDTFTKLATIASGLTKSAGGSSIMSLSFDRDLGYLWAYCDDNCGNEAAILEIEANPASAKKGRFGARRRYAPPTGLPISMNNEGISFAPEASCSGGAKAFYWIDDSNTGGHSIRAGSIPCGDLL